MTSGNKQHKSEDLAVRVMYFFNTMDSYLISSVLFYIAAWYLIYSRGSAGFSGLFPPWRGSVFLTALAVIALYLLIRMADFHPLFVPFSALGLAGLLAVGRLFPEDCLNHLVWFFAITSVIQILFMGLPMGWAARSLLVPFRIYANSFIIIAPTTISLPLTLYYQVFLAWSASSLAGSPDFVSAAFIGYIAVTAMVVRKYRKKAFIPDTHHPAPKEALFKRVIVLNIDGLSKQAFDRGDTPFLKSLESEYAAAPDGARTVYRALTNPAFASILAGVEPALHGVVNNNFNQSIRTQALPDIMPTRLYGNMHVRHFSRPEWKVSVVSLVEAGYENADRIMLDRLQEDLLREGDKTKLWITDLSEVDYCGHAWGSYSRQMARAVKRVDVLIEDFFAWLKQNSLFQGSLILISSDHGLYIGEHSFLLHPQEELVPLIFAGEGIRRIRIEGPVSIIDIAANISYALGMPYCEGSKGRVFEDIYRRAAH